MNENNYSEYIANLFISKYENLTTQSFEGTVAHYIKQLRKENESLKYLNEEIAQELEYYKQKEKDDFDERDRWE